MTRSSGRPAGNSMRTGARTSYPIRTRRKELVALGMLGLLVVGAPQLFGGVFPWTVLVIAGMAFATLAVTILAVRALPSRRIPIVMLAIGGAAVWTGVQALPLPCWLASRLAPDAVSELRAALALAGAAPPAWCTLSHDPGATRLEVLKGVAIVSSFLSAWWLSAQGARSRVILLVACSTLAMSVVAHLHMVLGLQEVFGVYRPVDARGGLALAPIMNPNNLGGFAAFGVPLWLGILRRDRETRMRVLAALATVLCATTVLFSLSRGAIAVMFGGIALFVLLQQTRPGATRNARDEARWRARLRVGAALLLAIGLGAYIAMDRVVVEFEQGGADKLALVAGTFQFAALHPWLGVGRGAFASAYTAHGDRALFLNTENFFTQWASDWGFPVAVVLVLTLGHALWRAFRDDASMRRLGAIAAIVTLAVQNLFDMGLELAGVAVAASALLGAAVAPGKAARRAEQPRRPGALSVALGALGLAGIALASLGPSVAQYSVEYWDDVLRARIDAKDGPGFSARLAEAVRLHPVAAQIAILAAGEAVPYRDRRALRWINRAMRLAPGWTAPHVQAFQFLWLDGRRDQALIELRVAAEIAPSAVGTYACALARAGSAPILRAAPRQHRKQREEFLELASNCVAATSPVSQDLDRVLLREFPQSPAAHEREATRLAARGDLDAALRELDAVRRQHPSRVTAHTLKAQLLFGAKRYAEAAQSAADSARSVALEASAPLWRTRASALAALGDDAGWAEAIAVLRRIASSETNRLAETYALEGQLHLERRQPGAALASYKAAYRIKEDPQYLRTYADISIQFGDRASALWAYMQLCEREPGNVAYCAKRDALLEQARRLNFGDRSAQLIEVQLCYSAALYRRPPLLVPNHREHLEIIHPAGRRSGRPGRRPTARLPEGAVEAALGDRAGRRVGLPCRLWLDAQAGAHLPSGLHAPVRPESASAAGQ